MSCSEVPGSSGFSRCQFSPPVSSTWLSYCIVAKYLSLSGTPVSLDEEEEEEDEEDEEEEEEEDEEEEESEAYSKQTSFAL